MADGGASLFYILAAAGSAVAAYSSVQQGKQVKYDAKQQAEQEKLAARDREIERRGRLLQALSRRTVAAASGGASLEGSPAALINADVRDYSLESLSSDAMTAGRVSGLRAYGRNAERIGSINAVGNLIDAGASLSQINRAA